MKEIQIYETEGTNLLYIVTDRNSDAMYYDKRNLTVSAVNGSVEIKNNGVRFFLELPRDFINPIESSVVDLVEIIQGYVNNIIEDEDPLVSRLNDIYDQQLIANSTLNSMLISLNRVVDLNSSLIDEQMVTNKMLKKIYNPE